MNQNRVSFFSGKRAKHGKIPKQPQMSKMAAQVPNQWTQKSQKANKNGPKDRPQASEFLSTTHSGRTLDAVLQ